MPLCALATRDLESLGFLAKFISKIGLKIVSILNMGE